MNGQNPAGARIYVMTISAFAALWALVSLGMFISGVGIVALVPFAVALLIAGIGLIERPVFVVSLTPSALKVATWSHPRSIPLDAIQSVSVVGRSFRGAPLRAVVVFVMDGRRRWVTIEHPDSGAVNALESAVSGQCPVTAGRA